ncbi:MAG: YhhN family protein [Bacteroidota bacterium]|nr:YhhN family protein [Bacteroidota bacterium]
MTVRFVRCGYFGGTLCPFLPFVLSFLSSIKIRKMLLPVEYLYFLVAVLEIGSEAAGHETLRFFTKPLLMILLIAFYVKSVKGAWNKVHKLVVAAFVFSWVGDVALMFVGTEGNLMGIPKNPHYFLAGLGGFLLTHILYAVAFLDVSDKKERSILSRRPLVLIPLVIYMLALLSLLVPAIGGNDATKPFLIPVLVYSAAIATMVLCATNRYKRVNDKSFALVFGGALLFMFSDSLIAINKFIYPFGISGIFIMILYIAGQYYIAKGCLSQFNIYSSKGNS